MLCPTHGFHNGRTGCPTCRRIDEARDTLRNAPARSHEYVEAMALLDEIGQRGTDLIAGDVSFDLEGVA